MTTEAMISMETLVSLDSILSLLQNLNQTGNDPATARKLHSLVIASGFDCFSILADHFIRISGNLNEASKVFIKLSHPTVYSWNAIISAHVNFGESATAIALFYNMLSGKQRIFPNRVTYLILLKACRSICSRTDGMVIHDLVIRNDLGMDVSVANTFIDMYAKCGCIAEARTMFDRLPNKDLVSWTAMITGYAQLGFGVSALDLFKCMWRSGLEPCNVAFLSALKACGEVRNLQFGRKIHDCVLQKEFENDVILMASLLDMYFKCSRFDDGKKVFNQLPKRNVIIWGSFIAAHLQEGLDKDVLELFSQMQQENTFPDSAIVLNVLRACGNLRALDQGRMIHKQIKQSEMVCDTAIAAALIDFYAKCGSLEEADAIFDQLSNKNAIIWAEIIAAYARHGSDKYAFHLFGDMLQEGVNPNASILVSLLKCCGISKSLVQGRLMHDHIVRASFDLNAIVGTSILDMYIKCGSLEEARKVFDCLAVRDTVAWSAMVSAPPAISKNLFEEMQQSGISPDAVTFLCMLKACTSTGTIAEGMLLHCEIIVADLLSDIMVGNALIDMYVKFNSLEDAQEVFRAMPTRTVVSWSSLITGFVEHGDGLIALQLFEEMQKENFKANEITLLYVLKACATFGVIDIGLKIHDQIIREGVTLDMTLGSAVVDMYGNCGSMNEAYCVFNRLPSHDTVSWGALLSACAKHGNLHLLMQCFHDMHKRGYSPNDANFASILSGCSTTGNTIGGWDYFNIMEYFDVKPTLEHYSCMIDLLSRAGYMEDAFNLLHSLPVNPNISVWTSLLTSCRMHGNHKIGSHTFSEAISLDPTDASPYLLVSSIVRDSQLTEHSHEMVCKE